MSTYRQELKSRFAALGIVIVVVLSVLLVRLWTMQVLGADAFAALAENNRVREISLEAPRGRIYDRNGVELVINRSALAISVDPAHEEVAALLTRARNEDTADDPTRGELDAIFGELAGMLEMTPSEVFERVSDVRQEALRPRVVAVDAPMEVVAQVLERQVDFPWVRVEELAVREYPHGSIASHLLGYTGAISEQQFQSSDVYAGYELGDTVGKTGAELQYEGVLQGDKGWRRIEVNASGRPQGVVGEQPPRPGNDIQLTIDIEVQRVAEEQLAAALAEARRQGYDKAKAGSVVVLDIQTGEVLAMASAPTYDPAAFIGGISTAEWESLNEKSSEYPLNNRAVMAAYPPASTFKVVTGLAGLEAGITYENKTYRCTGRWTEMGTQWPKWCWKRTGHGTLTFRSGMENSCDTVFYEIGYEFYKRKLEELQAQARAFGLGTKTGIDLPGEVAGRIPDAEWKKEFNRNYPEYQMWLPGDTVNMSIGQGDVLTSPLQMATVYAGLANDGVVMRPHILKAVLDSEGLPARTVEPEVFADTGASEESLGVIERSLVDVTREGTAQGAFAGLGVTVAGKTGTAEVKGKDDYAWFCAYAPVDTPRYAVAVIVEQGGHGGSVAGPAARNILAKLLGKPIKTVRATDVSR
ncbi:MAG TPA: penicillin-binding protein 2 [Coriobacteriia bacterium]|nr:penicillin-binding protein 2 [Coriobacteriia bacterium]